MKLYRITDCSFVKDISGYGAWLHGGRWNSVGVPLLYTAQNSSLAQLEVLTRFAKTIPVPELCLLVLDVPVRSSITIKKETLPLGWNSYLSPHFLKKIGDDFVRENKFLVLKVPSVVNPEENNYLVNPAHKDFSKIKILKITRLKIDRRLLLKRK